jgi:hypothetical protein
MNHDNTNYVIIKSCWSKMSIVIWINHAENRSFAM